ncbi:MAG: dephospho-CoA kinase [Actinomycetes bacterium]
MRIGLTGGIGSGKSSVARRLAEHGAIVVDADVIARAVVEPGTAGLDAVVEAFGAGLLNSDGTLDRAAMASLVFTDPTKRALLEGIVHPLVAAESARIISAAPEDAIVVYDIPLLAEFAGTARDRTQEFDVIIVVEAPAELRLDRLVQRGLTSEDAVARIQSQASDEQRREIADVVVINDDSLEVLGAAIDDLWDELTAEDDDQDD